MVLPNNYFVTGGVEGTRFLFEDIPVRRIVPPPGKGAIEHNRRGVGIFPKGTKTSVIEEAAMLDSWSRQAVTEDQRLECLRLLAQLFCGERE